LIFYSIGIIIIGGVYSVIGAAAGMAQEALWVSFLMAAAGALLTGLSYAEMTTTFPKAGAEFLYLRRSVPEARWAAFGVGDLVLIGGSATAATIAVAFGGYLRVLVDVPGWLAALALRGVYRLQSLGPAGIKLGQYRVRPSSRYPSSCSLPAAVMCSADTSVPRNRSPGLDRTDCSGGYMDAFLRRSEALSSWVKTGASGGWVRRRMSALPPESGREARARHQSRAER
jgi:hypothetical protein